MGHLGRRQAMWLHWREIARLAVMGVLGVAMVQWLHLVAISRLDVGLALLLEFTAPLLIAVWTWAVQRQAVHARTWAALATSLIGLAMVAQVSGGGADGAGGDLLGGSATAPLLTTGVPAPICLWRDVIPAGLELGSERVARRLA